MIAARAISPPWPQKIQHDVWSRSAAASCNPLTSEQSVLQPLKEDTCQPVKQRSKSRKQILSILYPTKFRSTLRTARQYHSSELRQPLIPPSRNPRSVTGT